MGHHVGAMSLRADTARSIAAHIMTFLASGWISYQTSLGRRYYLAWLYETRVVFVASGGFEEFGRTSSRTMRGVQTLGCFVAGRWLSTRGWRWASLLALESVVSLAAPCLCSIIGAQAAKFANTKLDMYAREVNAVVQTELDEKLHLQKRVSELEVAMAARASAEAKLGRTLEATNAKLDRYVDYAK